MGAELVLGIDIGSTTSKAALVSLEGGIVALEEMSHDISRPRPGWAEQDPEAVWWADVVALCRRLLPPAGGSRVVAAAVVALGPCLVLADAAGRPLRPAILYGIDSRAVAEIAELDRRLGSAAILARCGSPLTTQAVGPKLGWLARHEPAGAACRAAPVHRELVPRASPDRRIRARPPFGQPVRADVRRADQRLDRRVGRGGDIRLAAAAAAAAALAAGARRRRHDRRPLRRPGCLPASRSPPARSTRSPKRSAPAYAVRASCCWPTARPCSWPRS